MNLIERYAAEVGKYLPRGQRADIEAEIRSTLEDMLEERNQSKGPATDAMVEELLREYGAPREVAASYGHKQYLIGPRLFPVFEMVTKIVLAALFLALLVSYGFSVIRAGLSASEMAVALGKLLLQYLSAALTAFGNVVLVFAILERVLPASEQEDMKDKWDPADLAKEPDPDAIKPAEHITSILFTVAGLVILNGFPHIIGLYFLSDDKWTFVPILSQAFFRYMPWINLMSALQIALNLWLLQQGVWRKSTRAAALTLKGGALALVVVMLTGPAILQIASESVIGTPLADVIDELGTLTGFVTIPLLLAVILGTVVEMGQIGWKLLQPGSSIPLEAKK
jgi:hypothetical protein